jgi:hypothetical protein
LVVIVIRAIRAAARIIGGEAMKYTLVHPCSNCPFRCDVPGYLSRARAREIARALTALDQTFSCHKLNEFGEDEETGEGMVTEGERAQHCAGALILLEKLDSPNQMMRICERLGLYDRRKLKMDAPVFDTAEEFVRHHGGARISSESD